MNLEIYLRAKYIYVAMKLKYAIPFAVFCISILFSISCLQDAPEVIPDSCYEESGLISWTVNDEIQLPETSIEPNLGINLDYLFSLDKLGSWSINFTNETYTITFTDFDNLISTKELDKLSESEWESLIQERGTYDFVYEPEGRQELTLNSKTPLIFIGDSQEEVVGGEVKISTRKTSVCKFLILDLTAILEYNGDTYAVKIKLEEPYTFP